MSTAVQRRRAKSFLAHFVPPGLVWCAGIYCLYRATQVEGSVSERTFALGLLLVVCATVIFSATRSRQTTTRERALERQLDTLRERLRCVERKYDELILDLATENAAHVLKKAAGQQHSGQRGTKPRMQIVNRETSREG